MADRLRERGAALVDDITVYRTVEEDLDAMPDVRNLLHGRTVDLVTFTSSSTVKNFHRLLARAGITDTAHFTCAAIGPITARTAGEMGFTVSISAPEHTIPGLVDAILEYYRG